MMAVHASATPVGNARLFHAADTERPASSAHASVVRLANIVQRQIPLTPSGACNSKRSRSACRIVPLDFEPKGLRSGERWKAGRTKPRPGQWLFQSQSHRLPVTLPQPGKMDAGNHPRPHSPSPTRIAHAESDATYLLAGVKIVAEYRLHNINRARMENLVHRLFGAAQIDLTIPDRFDDKVKPKEWFLVPLPTIDEAVKRIVDGSITEYTGDPASARLKRVE
jgi:hypothetical protein